MPPGSPCPRRRCRPGTCGEGDPAPWSACRFHTTPQCSARSARRPGLMRDISLVIPTRNRAAQLADTLPHLERLQTRASWEMIIVDNASTDGTYELLSRFAASRANTKVLREPKVGAAAARNAGWRAAEGRIVTFTDDDCY